MVSYFIYLRMKVKCGKRMYVVVCFLDALAQRQMCQR